MSHPDTCRCRLHQDRYGKVKHQEFLKTDAETIRDYIEKKKKTKVNPQANEFFSFEPA